MLEQQTIEAFQQLCNRNPDLNLDDIFELDTTIMPDEMYPHLAQLEEHFAQQEEALWKEYFKADCVTKGLQENSYMLFYGRTERGMSDAMQCFYFLIDTLSSLEPLMKLAQNNSGVSYNLIRGNHYISFQETLIQSPGREESFYALDVQQENFKMERIIRPKFLSYPYYAAHRFSQMLKWTDLGDTVRDNLLAKNIRL